MKGWRIGALAQSLGMAESTLRRLENGLSKEPRLKARQALARALGVTEASLFGKVGDRDRRPS
jgi:transcriptional regulator with XRE-family HTH domain